MPPTDPRRRYWRRSLRLIVLLLAVCLLTTFGIGFFARELSFDFFGAPFSYWVASQGALLVYLLIVLCHALVMRRLDRRLHDELHDELHEEQRERPR